MVKFLIRDFFVNGEVYCSVCGEVSEGDERLLIFLNNGVYCIMDDGLILKGKYEENKFGLFIDFDCLRINLEKLDKRHKIEVVCEEYRKELYFNGDYYILDEKEEDQIIFI